MQVRENLYVIVEKHPYSGSLNSKLLSDLNKFDYTEDESSHKPTNVRAIQRSIGYSERTKSMNILLDWIFQVLDKNNNVSFTKGAYEHNGKPTANIWAARYNKDQYTLSHGHYPFALYGFVYFLKSPQGASPLVLTTSGKKIKPEEGSVVIFPANLYHHVPKNKCEDRVVIAGNIGYDLNT